MFLGKCKAQAAHQHGKFFEYTELLYTNQNSLDNESLKGFAAQIGLDSNRFAADLASGKFDSLIKKDLADGDDYGVEGTPTVFVNGIMLRNLSGQLLQNLIERALQQK